MNVMLGITRSNVNFEIRHNAKKTQKVRTRLDVCPDRLAMPSNVALSMLCVIQDGMDQAKFRVPRLNATTKKTKLFEQLFRPQLHLVASWAHGAHIHLPVADEDLPKNSETQLEILARLFDILVQKSDLPAGVNLQQDNTYREGKNQFVMAFAILCVALGTFRHFTCSFLKVGHSCSVEKRWSILIFLPCQVRVFRFYVNPCPPPRPPPPLSILLRPSAEWLRLCNRMK